jgi:twinkle protein
MYYDQLSNLGIKLRRRSGQEKTTCPQCSESRRNKKDTSLSVNITEGTYNCHHCGWKGSVKHFQQKERKKQFDKPDQSMLKSISLNEKVIAYAKGRGISEETLKRFMIHAKEDWMPQTQKKERCIVFPYIRGGELINAKYRDGAKNFKLCKDAEMIFFGMQTLEGKHCAIITEGEWDALAVYEAGFGQNYEVVADKDGVVVEHELGRWAVLSVPNGASKGNQKLEYLDNCSDWLSSIDEFVIATDGDESGISLRDELVRRLGVEKCRILHYPSNAHISNADGSKRACKDLNEVLLVFGKDGLISLINESDAMPVDGITYLGDIFPTMLENFRNGVRLAPSTRFGDFDEYFRWKKGDINVIIGYGNHGKTTFWLQMMLTKSIYDGWRWAIFSPENYPANDFYDDLVEMYAGKWIDKMTEEEYVKSCGFVNDHIFYVYPENEHDIDSIHEKFRYLILKKGCDGVMIDPFNQLDKTQKPYERDDQYISNILKDIKRFALLNAVSYNIVMHPKNPTYNSDKSLPVVDMYDIAGGAMTGNKADQIISYFRPNFHIDKNDPNVQVYIQKLKRRRTGGKLGQFDMKLNWSTKRYSDMFDHTYCDPERAKRILFQEQSGIINNPKQQEFTDENPF